MPFKFAFQKIVDLKTSEKTQAEWTLSSAVGELRSQEQSLHQLRLEKQRMQDRISAESAAQTTVSQLMIYQSYMEHIDHKISEKYKAVTAAQNNVDRKKETLNLKMMEEKIWLNARDKAKQRFMFEMLKKEQDALDEMASVRHLRTL
ncbi:flagellar biosynthesis chaperone [Chlamydia abortus]|uniref:Flagellar FliJ protein n=1 Tax=Paenibacillus residui TaxID=629724 RepID=A0ABW3D6V4_9BACL|nr:MULTISPECIES: flagellar export protein FliJ [Paenibacillaceae]SHE12151.1 flagellar biosynthesis chaperone [Chlamydia abortus]